MAAVAGKAHDSHSDRYARNQEHGQWPPPRIGVEAQRAGQVDVGPLLKVVRELEEGPARQRDNDTDHC